MREGQEFGIGVAARVWAGMGTRPTWSRKAALSSRAVAAAPSSFVRSLNRDSDKSGRGSDGTGHGAGPERRRVDPLFATGGTQPKFCYSFNSGDSRARNSVTNPERGIRVVMT